VPSSWTNPFTSPLLVPPVCDSSGMCCRGHPWPCWKRVTPLPHALFLCGRTPPRSFFPSRTPCRNLTPLLSKSLFSPRCSDFAPDKRRFQWLSSRPLSPPFTLRRQDLLGSQCLRHRPYPGVSQALSGLGDSLDEGSKDVFFPQARPLLVEVSHSYSPVDVSSPFFFSPCLLTDCFVVPLP